MFLKMHYKYFHVDVIQIKTCVLSTFMTTDVFVKYISMSDTLIFWPRFAVTTMATGLKMSDDVSLNKIDPVVIKTIDQHRPTLIT